MSQDPAESRRKLIESLRAKQAALQQEKVQLSECQSTDSDKSPPVKFVPKFQRSSPAPPPENPVPPPPVSTEPEEPSDEPALDQWSVPLPAFVSETSESSKRAHRAREIARVAQMLSS